jgi:hypothetical protein
MTTNKHDARPSFPFYVDDWLSDPNLKMCSMEARGMWIDLLCLMWRAPERGTLTYMDAEANVKQMTTKHIAKLVGEDTATIARCIKELDYNGVFSKSSGTKIYSRRMVRDAHISEVRAEAGRKGGSKQTGSKTEAPRACARPSPSSSPSSSSKKDQEKSGKLALAGLDNLAMLYPKICELLHTTHSVQIPDLGSTTDIKWQTTLVQLVNLDKHSESHVCDVLLWILNDEPDDGGFTWRSQFQSPAGLRKRTEAGGTTKFQKMAAVYDKATSRMRRAKAEYEKKPKRTAHDVTLAKCWAVADGATKAGTPIAKGEIGEAVESGPESIAALLASVGLGEDVVSKVLGDVKGVQPADGNDA